MVVQRPGPDTSGPVETNNIEITHRLGDNTLLTGTGLRLPGGAVATIRADGDLDVLQSPAAAHQRIGRTEFLNSLNDGGLHEIVVAPPGPDHWHHVHTYPAKTH